MSEANQVLTWGGKRPGAGRPPTPQPKASKPVEGRPFTVAHFRKWSARFKLKSGYYFELDDYQAAFLEDLFARDSEGNPVFAELWLVVPEGNGKTTFFALVVLYTIEFRQEAWVPVAASARDQAVDLTYRIAAGFIERNHFEVNFDLHPGYRQIVHKTSRGSAKIFASDAASGDGVDPTLALIEELHRLPKMDLYETWAGKLDKSGGQLVVASTAGEVGSPFELLRERIRQAAITIDRKECFVRAVAPGVVLHEWAIPGDGDPEDLELVAKANPFRVKTVDALAKKRAKPSWNLQHWRRFVCNMPGRSDTAAIQEAEWQAASSGVKIPAGIPIWLGLDLAWKWDTTAVVPLWIRDPKFHLFGPAQVLIPPRDGSSLDPNKVEHLLLEIHSRNPIHTVVMDPTKGEQMMEWIKTTLGAEVIDRGQANQFAALDYQRFMEGLRNGVLRHSGDADLTRHALNAVARMLPDGRAKFERPSQAREGGNQEVRVIDALVAAAMVYTSATAVADKKPVLLGSA